MIPGSANTLLLATAAGGGGYEVSRSVRFNSADSAFLSRTPGSAGNRKTWTWAGWVKRSKGGARQGLFGAVPTTNSYTILEFDATDGLTFYDSATGGVSRQTSAVYRDYSAWMHVVLAVDTTAATAANRVKLYVNGSEVTVFASSANPAQNTDTQVNVSQQHVIGSELPAAGNYLDGYLADIHFIDGQALTPSSFTEVSATTGQLIPKAYTGSFGTNGFWLKFSDNSAATATTLGKDYSGNSNNWTPNNLSVTAGAGNDSLRDSPTNGSQTDTGVGGEVVGNYATWNPLSSRNTTLTNGNLDASIAAAVSNDYFTDGTIAVTSGKWYWEYTYSSGNQAIYLGVVRGNNPTNLAYYDNGVHYYGGNGRSYTDSGSGVTYGATYTTGDVIGVALDITNSQITFYKNGSSQGVLTLPSSTSGWKCSAANGSSSVAQGVTLNAGQRPFAYTAPSGFKALCSANLPAPTIADGSTVMDVLLWTGDGSTRSITGLGFNPDFVWIKSRSATGSHNLFDAVRGATNILETQNTDPETTNATTTLTAFNSDGFSLGSSTRVNGSGTTYVGWTWDAGTSNATNTSGTITSTVRANISAGFSVGTYTGNGTVGATIGHSLGVAPAFIIIKRRNAVEDWCVFHSALGNTRALQLNTTGAASTSSAFWNNTSPTSSVFTVSSNTTNNGNGSTYVFYAWTSIAGYSAFGSYTGNGSATDGPFVYTGMRPRWVLIKSSSASGWDWHLRDTARDSYNPVQQRLFPNTSSAESANDPIDVLSNGFKLRTSVGDLNGSGTTYIYAAFAEHPFQSSRAR